MKRNRWLLGFAGAAVMAIAGCSSDVLPTEGYYLNHPDGAHAVISPNAYMAAVGCTVLTGRPDSATVAIPVDSAPRVLFSCLGVNHDAIGQATWNSPAFVDT